MLDQLRGAVGWLVAVAAIAVMTVGLWPEPAQADPDVRQQQLAQRIACPWCHGQSLAGVIMEPRVSSASRQNAAAA